MGKEHTRAIIPPPLSLTASDGTGLRIVSLTARGVVEDPLAFTELHLTFQNPEPRQIEGHFDITLPPGATISRFAMRQPHGWQEGEVVELQAARRAYEDFLHRRQDPALMEKQPGNHFRARVFPIPPSGVKELLVSYSQERPSAAEPYRIHLRGLPTLHQLDLRVIIATVETQGSPGALGGVTLSQRTVKLTRSDFTPEADFEVPVPAPASGPRVGLRHDNLVVARVLPAAQRRPDPISGLCVLCDTSASRALGFAEQIERLRQLLQHLGGQQRELPLRLCCFDQEVVELYHGPIGGLLDRGAEDVFARVLERGALGASDLLGALRAAGAGRHPRVLLISDGVATAGATEGHQLYQAARGLSEAGVERLDVLACGGIRDEAVLKGLVTCGLSRNGIVADAGLPPAELLDRLGSATISGVRVTVPGAAWVWPAQLDGLQPGDQVLVYADLPSGRPFSVTLEGVEPQAVALAEAERPLLLRAWVNARIRKLMHQRDTLAESDPDLREALRHQIIELSTKHRVLSDFTALLVLETEADYAQFGIDRRALSDILTVGPTGIELLHRRLPAAPRPAPAWTPAKTMLPMDDADVGVPMAAAAPEILEEDAAFPRHADMLEAAAFDDAGPPLGGEPQFEMMASMSQMEVGSPAPAEQERAIALPVEARRSAPARPAPPPSQAAPEARPAPAPAARTMAAPPAARAASAPPSIEALAGAPPPGPAFAASMPAPAPAPSSPPLAAAAPAMFADEPSAQMAPSPAAEAEESPSLLGRIGRMFRRQEPAPPEPPPPPPRPIAPAPVAPAPAQPAPMPASRRVRAREAERPAPVTGSVGTAPQPPPPESLPYTGHMLEIMRLLRGGNLKAALTAAQAWHEREPGDVLALIALGEALEALGEISSAARAYGSLIDLFPGRADLRRFAGQRLDGLDRKALLLAVDTYRKAREQRPDHPHSHRLLAYALVRAGEFAEAFSVIAEGSRREYPANRFPGVPRILKEDVGLIAAAWLRAEPRRTDEIRRLLREAGASLPTGPSLRFVLNWETDANDVDFHIHDGQGGHAYFRERRLPSGGELYADVTTGYGPECFTIEGTPRAYPYRLQAHYYSRGPMGYGMGKLEIIEHDGQGGLRFEERPYLIMQDRAFIDLGVVKGPLSG